MPQANTGTTGPSIGLLSYFNSPFSDSNYTGNNNEYKPFRRKSRRCQYCPRQSRGK